MSISSYYKDRDKLFEEQVKERELMLSNGVEAADIEAFHKAEYEAWKANRNYELHNSVSFEEIGEDSAFMLHFERASECAADIEVGGFLDSIEDEKLLDVLRELPPDDLALVEACLVNDVTHEEYAARVGKSRSAVTRKLERLKKKIAAAVKK